MEVASTWSPKASILGIIDWSNTGRLPANAGRPDAVSAAEEYAVASRGWPPSAANARGAADRRLRTCARQAGGPQLAVERLDEAVISRFARA